MFLNLQEGETQMNKSFENDAKEEFFAQMESIIENIVDQRFQVLENDLRETVMWSGEEFKEEILDSVKAQEYVTDYELYEKVKAIIDDANVMIDIQV